MAHKDAWPSIVDRGLLSTSALLTLFGITGDRRDSIELARRPCAVVLDHPKHGRAVIRDNRPISESKLALCLEGIDRAGYYRLVNKRVFFWVSEKRLEGLLTARAYRFDTHLVIMVDTAALVHHYAKSVTLSAINSGATLFRAMGRGPATFVPIEQYDYEERRRIRGRAGAIAELAVDGGVSNILDIAVAADLRFPGGRRERIWARA